MSDFKQILLGVSPTEIFRQRLASNPTEGKWDLASEFMDHFERVDGVAAQIISGWHRPGGRPGLSDQEVDSLLLQLLREAGYEVSIGGPTTR